MGASSDDRQRDAGDAPPARRRRAPAGARCRRAQTQATPRPMRVQQRRWRGRSPRHRWRPTPRPAARRRARGRAAGRRRPTSAAPSATGTRAAVSTSRPEHDDGGQDAGLHQRHRHAGNAERAARDHHADEGGRPGPQRASAVEAGPQPDRHHRQHVVEAGPGVLEARRERERVLQPGMGQRGGAAASRATLPSSPRRRGSTQLSVASCHVACMPAFAGMTLRVFFMPMPVRLLSDRLVHGDELHAVGEGGLHLHVVDHLGDARPSPGRG